MDLLKFKTYEEYLQSMQTPLDSRFLQKDVSTKIVQLGYRSMVFYEKDEFYNRRQLALELMNSKVSEPKLFSSFINNEDEVLRALAEREKENYLMKLSTIIYVQHTRNDGFDISGYIDFEASLRGARTGKLGATDWKAVFEKRVRLQPKPSHLIYYDWKSGRTASNESQNYKIIYGSNGSYFIHKYDHKAVPVTTVPSEYKANVVRTMIHSEYYGYVILYDHRIRRI